MEINVHHIGGRWGTVPPIEGWDTLYRRINLTLYEPDELSRLQIERQSLATTRGFKSVAILPHCIGSASGEVDFHLCFDRNASSIHKFDPQYTDWNFFTSKFQRSVYVFGTANRPTKTIRIECVTLDDLIVDGRISTPDILSVDCEGASNDILKGAKDSLRKTLGIFIEASTHPIHKNEASLSEILSLLRDNRFLMISTGSETRASITRMPIGVFDLGVSLAFEDMIFLKNPIFIEDTSSLLKLAAIALYCGCTGIAHSCFEKLDRAGLDIATLDESYSVLIDFFEVYKMIRHLRLPTIGETYNEEMYNIGAYLLNGDEVPRTSLARLTEHRRANLEQYLPIVTDAVRAYNKSGGFYSKVYSKYGLTEWAEKSAATERQQLQFLIELLKKSVTLEI